MSIFRKIRHYNVKLLIAVALLSFCGLPLSAQDEMGDTISTFRFFSGRDMFYVPILNNGEGLTHLFEVVDRNKQQILNDEISVWVDGFYVAQGPKAEKRLTAKLRSNRVKSELITRKGLKEANFVTHNQPGAANYVIVRLFDNIKQTFLSPEAAEAEPAVVEPVEPAEPVEPVVEPVVEQVEVVEPVEPVVEQVEAVEEVEPVEPVVEEVVPVAEEWTDSRFALKTNLLDYVALMPNLEVEWKFKNRWSVALEWQGAWYAKESDPRKVYRLSTIIPEVRFWPIERSMWHGMYVGLFVGAGRYDLSNATRGHEGEGALGGLSVGYMWPISKHLSLDAGLGVGYARLRDKVYEPFDGHYLYQYTKKINYVGPLRLKLSLVWRIPQSKKGKVVK